MRKTILFFIAIIGNILLISFSNGPATVGQTDRTGAPFADGQCANCHNGGNFNASVQTRLFDGTAEVSTYEPGKQYTVEVEISSGSGNPTGYGFQAVCVDANQLSVGQVEQVSSGMNLTTLDGRQYVEHQTRSQSNTFRWQWVAPTAETGEVTFYVGAIASNSNFNNSGDEGLVGEFSFPEQTTSSLPALTVQTFNLSPNPVKEILRLEWTSEGEKEYLIRILDSSGREVHREVVVGSERVATSIPLHHVPQGMYYASISRKGEAHSVPFIKW